MQLINKILTNGYMALIPVFIWNYCFTSALPVVYQPASFNHDIPVFITAGENIFRSFIFILPLFFKLGIGSPAQSKGLLVFITGIVLYFVSWLVLMFVPESIWRHHVFVFSAPAYTPVIWLVGLSMMVERCYVFKYSKWHYIAPAVLFSVFHVYHAVYVFNRAY
ncbi:MAG: hypothetical protein OEY11_13560 [Gammaproteobacteria bacterium]|nr:hypothetical protein [Gammaproteobacteria bacterium]